MLQAGKALRALAVVCACVVASPVLHAEQRTTSAVDFGKKGELLSADARFAAQWVLDTRDNGGRPFAIVDKKDARLHVFSAAGRVIGSTPALLGLARGDHSMPGVGKLPASKIPEEHRTTPGGRYVSEPGRNLNGEHVVWVDYDNGIAIHRLRAGAPAERRAQRLASKTPDDNRVSAGCVVVGVSFYERAVKPLFGHGRGVVYVLPDTKSVQEMLRGAESDL